jgi:DNA-binding NarL/FixJ family response regulator
VASRFTLTSDSAATTSVEFDQALVDEAADLYADLRRILRAATTERREVKELFHMVIDRIVVTERTLEEIRAVIRWKDGSPPTEIAMELPPYVHREIARLARAGWSNTAIARHLNERG